MIRLVLPATQPQADIRSAVFQSVREVLLFYINFYNESTQNIQSPKKVKTIHQRGFFATL